MRIALLICITAVLITVIHDIVSPLVLFDIQLELARALLHQKPSIEIIPTPTFRGAEPDLRKEKL